MHERFDVGLRCGGEGVIEQHAGSEGFCVAIRLGVVPRSRGGVTLAYQDASGLFPDCQRVESLGKRSWKGDSRRLNGNAAPGCVETYSSEFLRGSGRWRARVDECRAQQCIGAMHRMPIRLLGRGRSGTEHELAPSFARKSALRAVTPPFPTREARLGTVEAHPTATNVRTPASFPLLS